jgi:hypothetical protein
MPPFINLIIHVDMPRKLSTFIEVTMDRPNSPYLLVVTKKEEKETNLHTMNCGMEKLKP